MRQDWCTPGCVSPRALTPLLGVIRHSLASCRLAHLPPSPRAVWPSGFFIAPWWFRVWWPSEPLRSPKCGIQISQRDRIRIEGAVEPRNCFVFKTTDLTQVFPLKVFSVGGPSAELGLVVTSVVFPVTVALISLSFPDLSSCGEYWSGTLWSSPQSEWSGGIS